MPGGVRSADAIREGEGAPTRYALPATHRDILPAFEFVEDAMTDWKRVLGAPAIALTLALAACTQPAPQEATKEAKTPEGTAATEAPAALGPHPFAVEDMLKLKRVSDPRLSPDGSRVAFVVTETILASSSRSNHIWISRVSGGAPVQLIESDKSEDTPRWSPDGKQLAFVSAREGGSQIWVAGVDQAGHAVSPKKITSLATEAGGTKWSPDGKWMLFTSDVYPECDSIDCNAKTLKAHEESKVKARVFEHLMFRHWVSWKEGRFSHLFIVPVDGSAAPRDLTPGAADVPPFSLGGPDGYAFSPDSREVAYTKKTDPVEAISTNSDLFLLDVADSKAAARKITTNPAADEGPLYSPDGRYIAYRSQQRPGFEADRWQLTLYDRKSGQARSITPTFDRAIDSYLWTPDSSGLFVTAENEGAVPIYRLAFDGGAPKQVVTTSANSDVDITSDAKTLVYTKASLRRPAEIYRANADGSGEQPITALNGAALAPFDFKAPESVWFAGAGGTRVQAWVVKPADFQEGRKYPLLYLVHGGPQNAWNDAWTFRWNAQVFANAGYIVFMPNPRGSTGFGQQLTDEISGDWGGKVYDDLMKGADFAEALPYVERGRTGAAGASFGGYMMDWFLGHTTRFKAIVSHAGVYNLTSMYGVTEELWFAEWDLKGTPWTNPDLYAKFSPHAYAKNFKTPTLVTHGELDFRVPIGEGLQLYTTLQRQGVPSKMVYFPDEGHWINKPGNSALWYHEFIAWMDKWVKAK
jgi:dipeptidyl aminopeptidase/acylaminoacyl peptidase